ncbi:MAG: TonB-dependent receptor [Candidatus Sulfopaludibacter sp.]|nr:TonB-dependent receptor [Candidatus Sulfopaludibacter sp.]
MLAQNNTGIISGRITDQTGAVVPNAEITVTQTDTGVDSVSQSNSEGLFRVPGLRDGPYKVTVTAAGFKKAVRAGFNLQIGQILDVEMKLEVGALTESVTVTNSIPLLDTQTSSTGQVMEGDYFYELPNYQHWEKGVLYYTPQVESSNAPWPGSLGNWNINGANSYQTAQYEDGMLATSMDGGTSINSVSVADEEVKVLTSAMPAEYGHATSGALIVVKKGGANEFHGEGGELFKNNPLVHRRFFQLQTNPQQHISDLFQMPDFVLSGPVIIPKLYNGKNRTFFEIGGSYHVDTSSNASSYSTPTAAMLAGNFGAFSNAIYDPASTSGSFASANLARTPFPGNIIPTNRMSAMWNAIMTNNPFMAPQAGAGSITPTGPNGNIVASGSGSYFNLTNQVRLDHSFTDKMKIFGSVTWGNQHQPQNNANIVYKPYDQYQVLTYTVQNVAALNFTYTITPHIISETRVGEYRRTANPRSLSGGDYTFAMAKTVPNLPANVYVNPIGFGLTEGTNGSAQLGVGTLTVNVNNNHQFNQDFTMVKGKHAFKFGYEWLWENEVQHNIGDPRLTLGFGQGGNAQTDGTTGIGPTGVQMPNTGGIQLANIMLGYVSSYSYAQQGASLLPVDSNQSFYIQDDWRFLPNLTFNLGLRYENETPAHSKFPGQLSVGSLTVPDNYYTSGSVPGLLTCPPGGCMGGWIQPKGFLWNRDNLNFQPRFGLAWNVEPNTVVRAGFAWMTLDWNLGYTNQSEIGGANFYNQSVSQPANVYTPLFNINQGVPAFLSVPQLANGEIPSSASTPSARPTITVIPSNYHHPYTLNWNVSIQHQLKSNYMVELSYVGLHNIGFNGNYNWDSRPYGTGIDPNGNVIDLTQPANWAYRNTWISNSSGVNGTQAYKPYPNLGGVNYQCNCVRMIYHSGTIKLQKRYSNGLTFLTFFTLQKGIQNSPGNLYLDQQEQRAVTGMTQKYRFVSSMTYELPFGIGKRWMNHGRLKDALLGGYSFAWNFSVWAPTPAGIGYSGGTYLNPVTGAVGGRQDYPNYEPEPGGGIYLVKDPQLRSGWQDIGTNRFVQTAQNPIVTNCGTKPTIQPNGATWGNQCEVVAPSFTNGNLPGNSWIEQRIIGSNASMYKDFRIKERFKAQIRLDYFTPFKWFNWSQANTTMTQTNPAIFMTPGLNDNGDSTEGGPSEMQLSFRIRF